MGGAQLSSKGLLSHVAQHSGELAIGVTSRGPPVRQALPRPRCGAPGAVGVDAGSHVRVCTHVCHHSRTGNPLHAKVAIGEQVGRDEGPHVDELGDD